MTEPRKIKFHPDVAAQFLAHARPMTAEERACDCGCEDIEREPADSITYYLDPEPDPEPPEFLTSPGVTSGWCLLDGEYVPVAIMSMGDGTANVMRTDL